MTDKTVWIEGFEQIRSDHARYQTGENLTTFNDLIDAAIQAINDDDFEKADEIASELDVGFDIQRGDYDFLPQEADEEE